MTGSEKKERVVFKASFDLNETDMAVWRGRNVGIVF
jgi:hypothetical protein